MTNTERETLQTLAQFGQPDERNLAFVQVDRKNGDIHPATLEQHHQAIAGLALADYVPESIATQYDVARNLYLYAWCEYRFHMEAQFKALSVLELALRTRIDKQGLNAYIKERNNAAKAQGNNFKIKPGLKTYIEYCRDRQLISEAGFTRNEHIPYQRAKQRYEQQLTQQFFAEGGGSGVPYNPDDIVISEEDRLQNRIACLVEHLNKIRNEHAHGTTSMHNWIYTTFVDVRDFIDHIFANHQNRQVETPTPNN